MVPRGGGAHRLFPDGRVRRLAALAEGDPVAVELEPAAWRDTSRLPDDLRVALEAVEGGAQAFQRLPPGMRQSFLRFLEQARRSETRAHRIERIVEEVQDRARRGTDSA